MTALPPTAEEDMYDTPSEETMQALGRALEQFTLDLSPHGSTGRVIMDFTEAIGDKFLEALKDHTKAVRADVQTRAELTEVLRAHTSALEEHSQTLRQSSEVLIDALRQEQARRQPVSRQM